MGGLSQPFYHKEQKVGINTMMNKIEEAIIYATVMHQGKVRKLGNIPYILHPLEVAQILSTMTDEISATSEAAVTCATA